MARCDYPQKVLDKGTRSKTGKVYNEDVMVPCGKCYNCRMNRIRSWIFRLKKEYEVCKSAHFITLTYDIEHVPLTDRGFMTLDKKDVQKFLKRLRKLEPQGIKYYLVGEYGGKKGRPHYHAIIYNVHDVRNIEKAWSIDGKKMGTVHDGKVTEASIAYTLEYISKQSDVPKWQKDHITKEFSLFSKGLGKCYLTDEIVKYHKDNPDQMYIQIEDNTKIPLPKYFRDKIFDDKEKARQAHNIQKVIAELDAKDKRTDIQKHNEKLARLNRLNSNNKKTKEI